MRPSDVASVSQSLGTLQHLGLLIYARVSSLLVLVSYFGRLQSEPVSGLKCVG